MLEMLLARFRTHAPAIPASPGTDLHPCTPGSDCPDCPNDAASGAVLPLCLVEAGQAVRIVQIDQEARLRKRLADLGLAVGSEVRVLRASYHAGPMILAVRQDARLAIGWAMANSIRVEVE